MIMLYCNLYIKSIFMFTFSVLLFENGKHGPNVFPTRESRRKQYRIECDLRRILVYLIREKWFTVFEPRFLLWELGRQCFIIISEWCMESLNLVPIAMCLSSSTLLSPFSQLILLLVNESLYSSLTGVYLWPLFALILALIALKLSLAKLEALLSWPSDLYTTLILVFCA